MATELSIKFKDDDKGKGKIVKVLSLIAPILFLLIVLIGSIHFL